MDLSVLHDNEQAIALYEKLGFVRVPVFAVKRRNPINEPLFSGPPPEDALNPYARMIVDEARRRGIQVEVTDAEGGFFRLSWGGRSIHCRESLSELTSGVAVQICDDKSVTRRMVERAGVVVPEQVEAGDREAVRAFLDEARLGRRQTGTGRAGKGRRRRPHRHGLRRQGDLRCRRAVRAGPCRAVRRGRGSALIVIDYRVVAAAVRRPGRIVGDGRPPCAS
jgi:hypothetical protein